MTELYSPEARQCLTGVIDVLTKMDGSQRAASCKAIETYGTPFLYAVFGLVSFGDYDFNSGLWQLLGLSGLIVTAIALCVCFGYSTSSALLAAVLILATSGPLASDIRTGNVNQVQVALLSSFLLLRFRWPNGNGDVVAGIVLELIVGFKPDAAPVAAFLALLWLVDRRYATLRRQLQRCALAVWPLSWLGA